eukprot:gene52725-34174_t
MHDGTMAQWAEAALTEDCVNVQHPDGGSIRTDHGIRNFLMAYNQLIERLGPGAVLTWRPQRIVQTSPNSVRATVECDTRVLYEFSLRAGQCCRRELWLSSCAIVVAPPKSACAAAAAARMRIKRGWVVLRCRPSPLPWRIDCAGALWRTGRCGSFSGDGCDTPASGITGLNA